MRVGTCPTITQLESSSQDSNQGLGLPVPGSCSPGEQCHPPSTQAQSPGGSRRLDPNHYRVELEGQGQNPTCPSQSSNPTMWLPNTSQMPGTWPPRVTTGLSFFVEATDGKSPGTEEGGGWHASRTHQRFPPRMLLQEGPRKGGIPSPSTDGQWGKERLVARKSTRLGV